MKMSAPIMTLIKRKNQKIKNQNNYLYDAKRTVLLRQQGSQELNLRHYLLGNCCHGSWLISRPPFYFSENVRKYHVVKFWSVKAITHQRGYFCFCGEYDFCRSVLLDPAVVKNQDVE